MLKRFYRNIRHRQEVERDLSDELLGYVEEMTARKVAEGMEPAAARRAVLVELGGLGPLHERVREERVGFQFEATVWKPFLLALRRLWRDPSFTVTAILTLALAIGANTAILSIADHVLFRPMPYQDPDRLQVLREYSPKTGQQYTNVPIEHLDLIAEHHKGLSAPAIFSSGAPILVTNGEFTESIRTAAVSANYFEILGAKAYRGRLFEQRDSRQPGRGIVVTYAAWQKRFGENQALIGTEVHLGKERFDLFGVLPPGFIFTSPAFFGGNAEVLRVMQPIPKGEGNGTVNPVVRLNPGVTREQAQAEIQSLMAGIDSSADSSSVYPNLNDVRESVFGSVGRRAVIYLTGAAILVLLTGCANLAIMLLVRGQRSLRETGVRGALGASRLQLALPLIFEALIVGVAGAGLALATTAAAFSWLRSQVPTQYYEGAPVGVDLRVALLAMALGLAGGIVFSGVPAWRSARLDVQALLHGHDQRILRRGRLGGSMVVAQVALSVILVSGAIAAGRAFIAIVNEPLGFDSTNVITARLPIRERGPARVAAAAQVIDRLSKLPGVVVAGTASQIPMDGVTQWTGIRVGGEAVKGAGIVPVLPGFFEATGLRLIAGRLLNAQDLREADDAAVITEPAAKAAFGPGDPLRRTFEDSAGRRYQVVGVLGTNKYIAEPVAYVLTRGEAPMTLAVRMSARTEALAALVRKEVSAALPGSPVTVDWWEDSLNVQPRVRNPRFHTLVLGSFGGLALGLTALGVFAVVAFSVAVRMKEMGIRMAVGAEARGLAWMVVWQALGPVGVGLLLGLALTRWASEVAQTNWGLPVNVSPVWTLIAALAVAAAALVAAFLPARRASTVDPMIVLRSE